MSQAPTAARHTTVFAAKVSVGQVRGAIALLRNVAGARRHGRWWLLRPRRQVPLPLRPSPCCRAWQSVVEPPPQAVLQHAIDAEVAGAHSVAAAQASPFCLRRTKSKNAPSPPRCPSTGALPRM